VRSECAVGLGMIMVLNPKPDPVLTELSQNCLSAEASPLRASVLESIATILSKGYIIHIIHA
jgi:hypothetical protein